MKSATETTTALEEDYIASLLPRGDWNAAADWFRQAAVVHRHLRTAECARWPTRSAGASATSGSTCTR